ncbi:hypothetical protein RJP21_30075 [Paenibacillus sp. VCA1]|uniref:hypothetical protein n=1 Tax=Paenibacillus sp. VCA1 TaxID=3039148 RepID=UPI002871C157|nr:hypothetical protein [Paenibacillus sp. VCA1]MDR9857844.1 hypothetical protein [Paenibacillus sp. VCA1]
MKKDVFAQRDMERRSLRKRLCRLYSMLIDGDPATTAIINEIKALRAQLLKCDPAEVIESFELTPKKKRPRLPA